MATSTFSSDYVDILFPQAAAGPESWRRYGPRIHRVFAYIHENLDRPLDMNVLADIACLSPHHWHRIYHAMTGETLARSVKRMRLHRAAGQLALTHMPILQIARAAGYPSLQSFNRTFRAVYDLPPARYRAEGLHQAFRVAVAQPSASSFPVEIETRASLEVMTMQHRGSYMDIGRAFDKLFARLAQAGLLRPGMRMFGLFHDDPGSIPEKELRSHAAVAGCGMDTTPEGIEPFVIEGGTYATLEYKGPYSSMKSAYQWLFGQWLTQSGFAPKDQPLVEEYLNNPRNTAPSALRTTIGIPLETLRAICK